MRGLMEKIVVVTGGGGGIGGATCRRFSEEGAKVAVFDIDGAAAAAVAEAIVEGGRKAAAFTCDIARHADCQKAVRDAEAALEGPIDVLVNNAGWDVFQPFVETSPPDWDKIISINLVGALNMHHAVLPGMVERKRGRIVNVSSDAARVGSSGEAVYAACKAGLIGFSKTIAREHARAGITINVVCPASSTPGSTPITRKAREIRRNSTRRFGVSSRWVALGSRKTCTARSVFSAATMLPSSPGRC